MRKIIIPTDFTVESLQLIEYAILNFPSTKLDIVLIAGFRLPDTRWGLTHFSERKQIAKQMSQEFNSNRRRIIVEHKDAIERISFKLFCGINSCAFQNFLEHIEAHDAIIPQDKKLQCRSNKWFDTTRFIKKNIENVIEVPFECKEEIPQKKYSLVSLFNL